MLHGDGELQSEISRRREEEVLRQVWGTQTEGQELPLQEVESLEVNTDKVNFNWVAPSRRSTPQQRAQMRRNLPYVNYFVVLHKCVQVKPDYRTVYFNYF